MFNINGFSIEELVERDYRGQLYLGEEIIVSGLTLDVFSNYSGIIYSFCYNYHVTLIDVERAVIKLLPGIIPSFDIVEPNILEEPLKVISDVATTVVNKGTALVSILTVTLQMLPLVIITDNLMKWCFAPVGIRCKKAGLNYYCKFLL